MDVLEILNKEHGPDYQEDIERVIKSPHLKDFIKSFKRIKYEYNKNHNKGLKKSKHNFKDIMKHWTHIKKFHLQQSVLHRNQRISLASLRKEMMEKESLRRKKEYLIRWEIRKEQMEQERKEQTQLQNNQHVCKFWLTLRAVTYEFQALRQNFDTRKLEKVKEEVRNFSAWRISYRFRVFAKKIRKSRDERVTRAIRNSLAFGAQTCHYAQEDKAKDILVKVLRNYAEIQEIENKFSTVVGHLLNIKTRVKRFLRRKANRMQEIRKLWDNTRDRLITEFLKAPKEIKKEIEKFSLIGSDTRDMMLDKYYSKKFNEFALKFIRWRFSIYQSCSAEEYEGIFK